MTATAMALPAVEQPQPWRRASVTRSQASSRFSLGALIALGINSFFHNFFDSDLTLWILAGFSVALMTLASKEPPTTMEEAW